MSLLMGLGSVNALVQGATGLLHGLKHTRSTSSQSFSESLKTQMESRSAREKAASVADQTSRRFVEYHDVDGNGKLTIQESGLAQEMFAKWDLDGNGELSAGEVRQRYLDGLNAPSNQLSIQG